MIVAVDVYYFETGAKVVGVLFDSFLATTPSAILEKMLPLQEEYEPGAFYKRELPCLLQLLHALNLEEIEVVVVDGYVYLDEDKKSGLGYYLYQALGEKIPVVGVAKSYFFASTNLVKEVYRGESKKPLYVSAVGLSLDVAQSAIQQMYGDFRMPYLLKLMDTETKKIEK